MAERAGLLNRYTSLNLYRGFESLPLRFLSLKQPSVDFVHPEVAKATKVHLSACALMGFFFSRTINICSKAGRLTPFFSCKNLNIIFGHPAVLYAVAGLHVYCLIVYLSLRLQALNKL